MATFDIAIDKSEHIVSLGVENVNGKLEAQTTLIVPSSEDQCESFITTALL